MVNTTHAVFKVSDRSYFGILKKEIHALAVSAGFSASKVGEIDIIVAEIVTNLVKHAGGGQLLVKLVEQNNLQGIEIISIDNGPGMADVTHMVADGVSTKKTLGLGLGSISRMSNVFQVYSQKDWGTVLLARIFESELPKFRQKPSIEIKDVVVAKPGEQECGDGFFYAITNDHIKLFLGDGLGHGPEAAAAVSKAGEAFINCNDETDPSEIIQCINTAVKKTRGLVGTVAVCDLKNKTWNLCGVGNILSKIAGYNLTVKNYTSYNGIIGLNVPRTLNTQQVAFENGQYIIMCSDGIKSRWDISKYSSIMRYDLSVLAASIFKDFARTTDDMSVAVCKINL